MKIDELKFNRIESETNCISAELNFIEIRSELKHIEAITSNYRREYVLRCASYHSKESEIHITIFLFHLYRRKKKWMYIYTLVIKLLLCE